MTVVSAQVSVYPLRRPSIGDPIEAFADAKRRHGVKVDLGRMSTVVVGPQAEVFRALEADFRAVSEGRRPAPACGEATSRFVS